MEGRVRRDADQYGPLFLRGARPHVDEEDTDEHGTDRIGHPARARAERRR